MFTGMIEATGKVLYNQIQADKALLKVSSDFDALCLGESIAVNGVCLTLTTLSEDGALTFDASKETLACTSLGTLSVGDEVNLERAMQASSRFGGHYVSGHVDTRAVVKSVEQIDEFVKIQIGGFSQQDMLYLIPKGSVSVQGVSLTINAVREGAIELMLIPHTLLKTNLSSLKKGSCVNIEFDYFTRIVAHQVKLLMRADEKDKNE